MGEIKMIGKQNFMGIEIPVIEGGFGDNSKVILATTIAEIHGQEVKRVNEVINNNIDEFEVGIDIIDLKNSDVSNGSLLDLGFTKQKIANSKNIYLLSEQGYIALSSLLKTDTAKEIRKQFRREYFSMRETIKNTLSLVDIAILKVVKANTLDERMLAMQEYNNTIVKPLEETIEKQKPMVGLAEMRIDKKGCYTITDVNRTLNIKRGKLTKWAKFKGYIHKTLQEVNNAGLDYFKVYSTDGIHNQIGITEDGLEYVKNNLSEICMVHSNVNLKG